MPASVEAARASRTRPAAGSRRAGTARAISGVATDERLPARLGSATAAVETHGSRSGVCRLGAAPFRQSIPRSLTMSATDELLANNERYAANFDKGDLPLPPA